MEQHPASYRDPAGFIFTHNDQLYRAVMPVYADTYDHFISSGLYNDLIAQSQIIPHEEVSDLQLDFKPYKVIKPSIVPFWSYPYEWSFSQLKDAALLTLQLALTGLKHGMILKDANAYNIQFLAGKPVLIDSLSFDNYEEGKPWVAFRQFCDHFLNPLLAMQVIPGLNPAFMMAYPDGLPAATVAKMLPAKRKLSINHQLYVYLAASTLNKRSSSGRTLTISKQKIIQNLTQLQGFITKLELKQVKSKWNNYYDETILSQEYLQYKTHIIHNILGDIKPARVIDVGCNTGAFSTLAAEVATEVIAMDNDMLSVDQLYKEKKPNVLPLVADISNPSPPLGWQNAERKALTDRLTCDLCMSLAVIHHLALSNNLPLQFVSRFMSTITDQWLLIEFVPKSDPKAQLLLENKKDIFPDYTQNHFEKEFTQYFSIEKMFALQGSQRTLYLLKKLHS